MACGCAGKRSTAAPRTPRGVTRAQATSERTKLFFFATPPASEPDAEEVRFTTIYAARTFTRAHPGWVLTTRREPIG